jgi:hypothetical protein
MLKASWSVSQEAPIRGPKEPLSGI